MAINLHNEIVNRFKRTFGLLCPSSPAIHRPLRHADHLVKQNLPPLMGRRDAAFDCAIRQALADLFLDADESQRIRVYAAIAALLDCAENDTRSVLVTLSSPDTEAREKKMLGLLVLTRNIALSLCSVSELEHDLFSEENSTLKDFAALPTESEFNRNSNSLSQSEINLVNQLRVIFERSQPKLKRYREYTAKSFSPSYASRYNKAYEVYSKLYADNYMIQ